MFENVPAVSSAERQQVLGALERLQAKLVQREEWTHSDILGNLKETLQSPLLNHILTLQHSVKQLRQQLSSMPPDACNEFSFSKKGQLIMSTVNPAGSSAPRTLSPSALTSASTANVHQAAPSPDFLRKWILGAAKGRHTEVVQLTRPMTGGLGFSVVGLNPAGSSSQGVFVKHISPGGIAHRDGRLQERDEILVINGNPLEAGISQQQALSLLQQPRRTVELVVARDQQDSPLSNSHKDQWGHVEEIELVNDGSGLGFGIVGGKSSGVVVRTLIPKGVAHRDGRLRTGDHILRIGATPTSGLTSDQVVKVLQGCGSRVNMLIARDPWGQKSTAAPPPPPPDAAPVSHLPPQLPELEPNRRVSKTPLLSSLTRVDRSQPNLEGYEIHEVSLVKEEGQSLGISIIGNNPLTSQDAVGVFVKHVVPGSAADQSGNIRVHDRLIGLDGISLHGLANHEVLEVMKQTGQTVVLTVVRKKARALERSLDKVEREPSRVSLRRSLDIRNRSPAFASRAKFESINQSTAQLTKGAELRAKWEQALGPQYQVMVVNLDPVIEDDEELQKSSKLLPIHTVRMGVELDSFDGHHYISSVAPGGPVDKHGVLRPEDELLEVNDVQLYGKSRREAVSFLKEVPPPFTLVCCRHPTSELEPETESEAESEHDFRPSSSLHPGPSVEEIEQQLSSMLSPHNNNREVDDLPTVRQEKHSPVQEALKEQKSHFSPQDEDEGDENEDDEDGELALWSPDIQMLELQKERDKGLGFSILDYQDPVDPARCVMVIRSLLPDSAAEHHGGLLPGDQLVSVNQTQLDMLTLSEAVDVLKSAPHGTVRLGIRKPLVGGELEKRREEDGNTQLPAHKDFKEHSLLPDHLSEVQEDEDEELILDGGLPRYTTSSSTTTSVPPEEEGKEMAVDEEEETLREENAKPPEDRTSSLPRRAPPTWEEWKLTSSLRRDAGETYKREQDEALSWEHESNTSGRNSLLVSAGFLETRDSEADSELTLTDTDSESIQMTARRKRRSQGVRQSYGDLPEREQGEGEETPAFSHWGPPRRVEVWPEEGQSLGLSIVGGRHVIKRLKNGEELKGIFIKQVLDDSPADKTRCLKTGDKILEVSGVDLRGASHEEAVNTIKSAPSPVVFVVQSLCATPRPLSLISPPYSQHKSNRTESPNLTAASSRLRPPPPYRPPSQSDGELTPDLQQAKGLV